jgi:hypothetical protein
MPKSQCGNEGNKTEAWGAVIAGILVLLLPALAHGASPSFDCKRAAGWAEKGYVATTSLLHWMSSSTRHIDAPFNYSALLELTQQTTLRKCLILLRGSNGLVLSRHSGTLVTTCRYQ